MLKVFNSRRKIQLVAVVVRAIAAVHKNKAGADTQVWVSSQATIAGVFVRKGAGNKETGKHALAGSNWARVCAREERRKGGRGGAGEERGERREEGGGEEITMHTHMPMAGKQQYGGWKKCGYACGLQWRVRGKRGVCASAPSQIDASQIVPGHSQMRLKAYSLLVTLARLDNMAL